MAAGYWKLGRLDDQAIFTLFFRHAPFGGGFTLAAGLEGVVAFIEHYRFSPAELEHLAGLVGNDDRPLFEPAFLDYLADLRLTVDLDAMPEGTLAFPHEPLAPRHRSAAPGPAARERAAQPRELPDARGDEGGARRVRRRRRPGHGVRAAAGAGPGRRRSRPSRAAYLGGCAATSNVLAGRLFGIPVRGTHAHSWVLSFADEHDGVRRVGRGHARQRRAPRRHLRHGGGHRATRSRPVGGCASAASSSPASASTRATSPTSRSGARDARRRRLRGHADRRVQRPRPGHDRVAPGRRARGSTAGAWARKLVTVLRPAGARAASTS